MRGLTPRTPVAMKTATAFLVALLLLTSCASLPKKPDVGPLVDDLLGCLAVEPAGQQDCAQAAILRWAVAQFGAENRDFWLALGRQLWERIRRDPSLREAGQCQDVLLYIGGLPYRATGEIHLEPAGPPPEPEWEVLHRLDGVFHLVTEGLDYERHEELVDLGGPRSELRASWQVYLPRLPSPKDGKPAHVMLGWFQAPPATWRGGVAAYILAWSDGRAKSSVSIGEDFDTLVKRRVFPSGGGTYRVQWQWNPGGTSVEILDDEIVAFFAHDGAFVELGDALRLTFGHSLEDLAGAGPETVLPGMSYADFLLEVRR